MNIKIRDIGETVWVMNNNEAVEMEIRGIDLSLKLGTIKEYHYIDGKNTAIVRHYDEEPCLESDVEYCLTYPGSDKSDDRVMIKRMGYMVFPSKAELLASL